MAWTSEQEEMSDAEREELMSVGAQIIADIEELIRGVSRAIRTRFTHGVTLAIGGAGSGPMRSAQIVLLFTITDIGGSEEGHIRSLISQRMEKIFEQGSMTKYKAQWGLTVEEKEDGRIDPE